MSQKSLKCVVVGDGTVGKTSLLIRYTRDEFSSAYIPTVFENYVANATANGENYDFHLFDTAGQEQYKELRKFTFDDTDVFIVCFSVVLWSSFINVREKWIPELQEHSPNASFIIVGTKTDLRTDEHEIEKLTAEGRNPITMDVGEKLAAELNAHKYLECSALTKENVDNVFKEAMNAAIAKKCSTVPVLSRSQSVIQNYISSSTNKKCCCSAITKCYQNNCTVM